MLKNHTLIDARYIDESHKHVETLWVDDANGKIVEEIIEADPTQTQWKEFMKVPNVSVEQLEASTEEWKRQQTRAFDELVNARVKELRVLSLKEENKIDFNTLNIKDITSLIIHKNKDEDALFKLKLNLLELESVKNSTTAFKKKLRKAKSLLQCFSMVNEVHKD